MHLRFEPYDLGSRNWSAELDRLPGGLVCQTPAWLSFLQKSQRGTPVAALLTDRGTVVGAFAGMIVRKAGLRILGSPFPGWTTPYMGMDLAPGVDRRAALERLVDFAFRDLRCVHLELMDRHLQVSDLRGLNARHRLFRTSEVDLLGGPDELIASFSATARRYVRKAARDGLVVEEVSGADFADEFYDQLQDVFGRQHLVPTYDRARPRLLIDSLPRESLLMLRARTADGRSAGTSIFHAVDKERAYLWGIASWRDLVHLHPNELLMFEAMNLWRERGLRILDLGGAGAYKEKYHPRATPVPWVRISKYPFIPPLREAARLSVVVRQRVMGWGSARRTPRETR